MMIMQLWISNVDPYTNYGDLYGASCQAKVTSMPSSLYKTKEQQSRDLEEYNITNCLAYCFYSPLWLAGPTTTFNAFTSHIRDRLGDFWFVIHHRHMDHHGPWESAGFLNNPLAAPLCSRSQEAVVGWKLLLYATRLLFCFVLLEVMSLGKQQAQWQGSQEKVEDVLPISMQGSIPARSGPLDGHHCT